MVKHLSGRESISKKDVENIGTGRVNVEDGVTAHGFSS